LREAKAQGVRHPQVRLWFGVGSKNLSEKIEDG
jgi:hypothetical protein